MDRFRKEKRIILIIMIIAIDIIINNVLCLEILIPSESTGELESSSCTTSVCATDISGSGLRISIVNKSGQIVTGTKTKNFWPNDSYKKLTGSSYTCSKGNTWAYSNSYENTLVDIGLPTINSTNVGNEYNTYFKVTLKNNLKYIENIISELKGTSKIDFFSIENANKYFLKLEPVYKLKESYNGYCSTYIGTSYEILFSAEFAYKDSNTGADYYGTDETYYQSAGCAFTIGGGNGKYKTTIEGKKCKSYIGGNWNVIRNYLVGIYTPCEEGADSSSMFNSVNKKCFSKSLLTKPLESFNGAPLNDLIKTYKEGNGLGVGYVKISDYLAKITIIKTYADGKAATGTKFTITKGDFTDSCTINDGNSCSIRLPETSVNGTYTITESGSKLTGYSISSCTYGDDVKCTNITSNSAKFKISDGKGTNIKITNENSTGIRIKKIDDRGTDVIGAVFDIYNSNGTGDRIARITSAGGEQLIPLSDGGTYRIYERADASYEGATCEGCNQAEIIADPSKPSYAGYFTVTVEKNKSISIIVKNIRGCTLRLRELRLRGQDTLIERHKLYKEYEDKQYNSLYNTSTDTCYHIPWEPSFESDCLYGKIILPQFNSSNMSFFTNVLKENEVEVGLCQSYFDITKPSDVDLDSTHFIERGLPIIKTTRPISGNLTTTCFLFTGTIDRNKTYTLSDSLNDNLSMSFKYNNKEMLKTATGSTTNNKSAAAGTNSIVFTTKYNYYFKPIYLSIGSGQYRTSACSNCNLISYGVISDPSDDVINSTALQEHLKNMIFSFKFDITSTSINSYDSGDIACPYSLKGGIYCDEPPCDSKNTLEVEFRTIDVDHPFPGKTGNDNRAIGSNWRHYIDSSIDYYMSIDFDKNGEVTSNEIQKVTQLQLEKVAAKMSVGLMSSSIYYTTKYSGVEYTAKLDLDGDNKVTTADSDLFWRMKVSDVRGKETYIDKYITNAPNSYGRDSSGNSKDPIYSIILTPSDIKQIRKYNSYTTYDDYISMSTKTCNVNNPIGCGDPDMLNMKFVAGLRNGVLEFKGKSNLTLSHKLIG